MKPPKKQRKPRALKPGEALFAAESIKPGLSKVEAARRAGLDYVPQGEHVARYRQELIRKQMTLADISTERTPRTTWNGPAGNALPPGRAARAGRERRCLSSPGWPVALGGPCRARRAVGVVQTSGPPKGRT